MSLLFFTHFKRFSQSYCVYAYVSEIFWIFKNERMNIDIANLEMISDWLSDVRGEPERGNPSKSCAKTRTKTKRHHKKRTGTSSATRRSQNLENFEFFFFGRTINTFNAVVVARYQPRVRAHVGKIASTESRCIRDIEKHRKARTRVPRYIARTVYTRALVIYIFFSFVFCFTRLIRYLFHDTRPLLHRADHCFSSLYFYYYYYYYHTVCSPHTRDTVSRFLFPSHRADVYRSLFSSPAPRRRIFSRKQKMSTTPVTRIIICAFRDADKRGIGFCPLQDK